MNSTELDQGQRNQITAVQQKLTELIHVVQQCGDARGARARDLAIQRIEEAGYWAVKAVKS